MANPTAAIQVWNAADYDWLTASSGFPAYEMQQSIDAWLQQITTNPSVVAQSNLLPRMLKDVNASNDPEFFGVTMAFPQEPGHEMYVSMHSRSTSGGAVYVSPAWVDDGSNGGYGQFAGTNSVPSWSSSVVQAYGWHHDFSMRTSTYDMAFMTWQDVTDGEEAWGIVAWLDGLQTSSYSWGWGWWRDQSGHWVMYETTTDSSSIRSHGFDTLNKTSMAIPSVKGRQSSYMPEHFVHFRNMSSSATPPTNSDQLYWYPANEKIINWTSTSSTYPGSYAAINGTAEVYLKVAGGPLWVRYNPVGAY